METFTALVPIHITHACHHRKKKDSPSDLDPIKFIMEYHKHPTHKQMSRGFAWLLLIRKIRSGANGGESATPRWAMAMTFSQTRLIPQKILKGHIAHYCITTVIAFKAYHSVFHWSSFTLGASNVLCQRGTSCPKKHISKLPRFMVARSKTKLESGNPLKLQSRTKQ